MYVDYDKIPHAGARAVLPQGDGSAGRKISRRRRGADLLRDHAECRGLAGRQDLCQPAQGRGHPGADLAAPAAAPGRRALSDPPLRLSGDRGQRDCRRRCATPRSRRRRRMRSTCRRTSSRASATGRTRSRPTSRPCRRPRPATNSAINCTAQDYLVYAYLQLGQDKNARGVIDDIAATACPIPMPSAAHFARAASPARYMVERGDWNGAAKLEVEPSKFPHVMAITHFARALGAARSGNPDAAKADIAKLAELRDQLRRPRTPIGRSMSTSSAQIANAWMLYAEGKYDEALKAMSAAADAEDKTEKSAGHAGPAGAGARTLRRHAARPRHGQGGAGGVRGDHGEGAEPLQRLSSARRRPRKRSATRRKRRRFTKSWSRSRPARTPSGPRWPPPGRSSRATRQRSDGRSR